MNRRTWLTLSAVIFCAAAGLWADISPDRLEKQAQAYFNLKRFNGSVLVAVDGKPLLNQGFGLANAEWGISASPETKYRLGSMTKQFTSRAILLLALGEDVPLPGQRKEIQVPAETMSKFVGEYQLRPGFMLVVTLENHQLMTQATGQDKIPVFAESETRFFPKVVDATIEFQRDADGVVTSLVLEQDGNRITGKRTK